MYVEKLRKATKSISARLEILFGFFWFLVIGIYLGMGTAIYLMGQG